VIIPFPDAGSSGDSPRGSYHHRGQIFVAFVSFCNPETSADGDPAPVRRGPRAPEAVRPSGGESSDQAPQGVNRGASELPRTAGTRVPANTGAPLMTSGSMLMGGFTETVVMILFRNEQKQMLFKDPNLFLPEVLGKPLASILEDEVRPGLVLRQNQDYGG
jgi:hypothetical protein